jgi:hypothetical protein
LVSYWKADSGPAFADSVGGNSLAQVTDSTGDNNGSLTTGSGLIGNCIDNISNTDTGTGTGCLARANSGSYQIATFSLSFWFKTSDPSINILASRGGDFDSAGFDWYIDGGGSGNFPAIGATINDGNWHHIVAESTGSQTKLYVDNTLFGTNTVSLSASFNNLYLFGIPLSSGGINGSKGLIDEIGFWSRALSASQVAALYNSGSGLSYDSFT